MTTKTKDVRVFQNNFLEALTRVDPLTPAILWIPASVFLFWSGLVFSPFSLLEAVAISLMGFFVWTLAEYVIHRFFFHFKGQAPWARRMVFIFHGLHHDDPMDRTRLVMPPAPAFLYITLFYFLFGLAMSASVRDLFLAGFLIGYLLYDYTHFFIHFKKPQTKWGKFLRKYHLQHHATGDEKKFGVSSPLWDFVFGTTGKSS